MSTPPQDQRAAVRYHSRPDTPLFSIGEEDGIHYWRARVHDISTNGIGMLVATPLDVGTTLDIELSAAGLAVARMLVARVVRVEQKEALWLVGCALNTPLSAEDVHLIAQQHGAAT